MATGDIIAAQVMDATALPNGGNIDGTGVIVRARLSGMAGAISTGVVNPALITVAVTRPGWNAAKVYSATSVTDTVVITKEQRQPYPNNAVASMCRAVSGGDLDVYLALGSRVFVADALVSITTAAGWFTGATAGTWTASLSNSSNLPYPMPKLTRVRMPPWLRMTAAGQYCEAVIGHWGSRNLQPVAAVDHYITDGTNTNTASVNTLSLSTLVTTPFAPGVFAATVPATGLTPGEVFHGMKIYPWVGNAVWDTATMGLSTFPSFLAVDLQPVNLDTDGSYAEVGAYLSPTGVAIGTPTIGPIAGIGAYVPGTTPAFANLSTLAAAAKTYNASGSRARPHNDIAAVVGLIPNGNLLNNLVGASMASATSFPPGLGYIRVGIEAGANSVTTGISNTAASLAAAPLRLWVSPMANVLGSGTYAQCLFDGGGASQVTTQPTKAAAYYWAVEGVTGTGNGSGTVPPLYRHQYAWMLNNNLTNYGKLALANATSYFSGFVAIHGGTYDNRADASVALPCAVGCASIVGIKGFYFQRTDSNGSVMPAIQGVVVNTCIFLTDEAVVSRPVQHQYNMSATASIGVRGGSIVNVADLKSTSCGTLPGQPVMQISSDWTGGSTPADNGPVQNFDLEYYAGLGSRNNIPYNEVTTSTVAAVRVPKWIRALGAFFTTFNQKGDLATAENQSNGTRTGNMAQRQGTDVRGIVVEDYGSNGGPAAATSWLGEVTPPLSQFNAGGGSYGTMVKNDPTAFGSNTPWSVGDLTPRPVLANRVPAGYAATKYDLYGTLRRNDGTGAAGPVESVAAAYLPSSLEMMGFGA